MVNITVDGFDGPVDLLLELIEDNRLDITALSLAQVTDQYWSAIESGDDASPDDLTDFISFGSKLLYVKSAALLEAPKQADEDLEERFVEVAGEITELLEEHKRFRDAVDLFRQLEEEGRRTYSRTGKPQAPQLPPGLEGVTIDSLMNAVKEALARSPEEAPEQAVIHIAPVTDNEKVAELETELARRKGKLRFRPLLQACETRTEIVVLFLAVLELIKAGNLWAEQDAPFGDIVLMRSESAAPAEEATPAEA